MALIEHDHMVQQVPAAVADPAFRDAVLPRAANARANGPSRCSAGFCAGAVQQTERDRGHGKEDQGGDGLAVISREREPVPGGGVWVRQPAGPGA